MTVAALAADTATCCFVALKLAPPRAARLVEAQSAGVYARTMAPLVRADVASALAVERGGLLVEVREIVAEESEALVKRFEVLKEEARAEASAQIEAARASMEEQAKALEADARARAEAEAARIIEEARSEAGRWLAGRSAEARAVQRVEEARAETSIAAWALQAMRGNETMAGRIISWVRANAPGAWKAALQNPERAGEILEPIVGLAQQGVRQNQETASKGRESGW